MQLFYVSHLIGRGRDGRDQGVVVQLLKLRRRSRRLAEGSQLKVRGLHKLVAWKRYCLGPSRALQD